MVEGKEIEVLVFHQETIKPSSPTPSHLRTFKLSVLDLYSHRTPMLIFYRASSSHGGGIDERSERLKISLSETLTHFYPLAGRLSPDLSSINCNDEGAHYSEARADMPMTRIIGQPKDEELDRFVPTESACHGLDSTPLLLVQATFFECGGLVIGLSFSHKIIDGSTIYTFLNFWSKVAFGDPDVVVPDFNAASRFLPSASEDLPNIDMEPGDQTGRRLCFDFLTHEFGRIPPSKFVFDGSSVAKLKAIAASETNIPYPSRSAVVSALIWKCSMKAARSKGRVAEKASSYLSWVVNIRPKLTPPLSQSSCGNLVLPLVHKAEGNTNRSLPVLVSLLTESLQEFFNNSLRKVQGQESVSAIQSLYEDSIIQYSGAMGEHADSYSHSSVCGLGFYDLDFGWGKPAWLIFPTKLPNAAILLDTADGRGVEAWVTLVEEEMVLLEHDRELLEFSSLNPPSPLQRRKEANSRSAL